MSPYQTSNRQILEEASRWFAEFRGGEVDRRTRRRFMRWLRQSPEHIRAYMEISDTYTRVPGAGEVQDADVAALIARVSRREEYPNNVALLDGGRNASGLVRREHIGEERAYLSRPAFRRAVAAAAVAATIAVGSWFASPHWPTYETQIGERRTITLEDGSGVELNARSKVRVLFTRTRRDVELLGGQALFKVAKDPGRPFIVSHRGTSVRAVGTEFDVNLMAFGTTVTVLEGRVILQTALSRSWREGFSGQPSEPRRLEVSAGEQVVVTVAGIDKSSSPNVEAATAWTQGQLEFEETPLVEAVAEFNRYSRRPLVIESPSLLALRINGVYSSTDTAALVLFLRDQPDVVVDETDTKIRITHK